MARSRALRPPRIERLPAWIQEGPIRSAFGLGWRSVGKRVPCAAMERVRARIRAFHFKNKILREEK
jgi:hypothetical protein